VDFISAFVVFLSKLAVSLFQSIKLPFMGDIAFFGPTTLTASIIAFPVFMIVYLFLFVKRKFLA
jgi:hypothetical protein